MSTWVPPGMRSTTGKPLLGPALKLTDCVTRPGAANAAVGSSSSVAASKIPVRFMTRSSSLFGTSGASARSVPMTAYVERWMLVHRAFIGERLRLLREEERLHHCGIDSACPRDMERRHEFRDRLLRRSLRAPGR